MFKKVIGWFKALFANEIAREVKKTMVATTSAAVNEFVNDPANQDSYVGGSIDVGGRHHHTVWFYAH